MLLLLLYGGVDGVGFGLVLVEVDVFVEAGGDDAYVGEELVEAVFELFDVFFGEVVAGVAVLFIYVSDS